MKESENNEIYKTKKKDYNFNSTIIKSNENYIYNRHNRQSSFKNNEYRLKIKVAKLLSRSA